MAKPKLVKIHRTPENAEERQYNYGKMLDKMLNIHLIDELQNDISRAKVAQQIEKRYKAAGLEHREWLYQTLHDYRTETLSNLEKKDEERKEVESLKVIRPISNHDKNQAPVQAPFFDK